MMTIDEFAAARPGCIVRVFRHVLAVNRRPLLVVRSLTTAEMSATYALVLMTVWNDAEKKAHFEILPVSYNAYVHLKSAKGAVNEAQFLNMVNVTHKKHIQFLTHGILVRDDEDHAELLCSVTAVANDPWVDEQTPSCSSSHVVKQTNYGKLTLDMLYKKIKKEPDLSEAPPAKKAKPGDRSVSPMSAASE